MKCTKCKEVVESGEMASNGWCKKCNCAAAKTWRQTYPDEAKRRDRKKYWNNVEKHRETARQQYWKDPIGKNKKHKEWLDKTRIIVYEAYGNKCNCCGELNSKFFTMDHVDNNGKDHRKELNKSGNPYSGTHKIYTWAIKNSFPKSLQILCFNCNLGKARNNGTCPHKEQSATINTEVLIGASK